MRNKHLKAAPLMDERLIDANVFKNYEITFPKRIVDNNPDLVEICSRIGDALDAQPTLDRKQIVRCFACEHWNQKEPFDNHGTISYKCEWFSSYQDINGGIYTHANDFCGYAARKQEAE